MQFEEYPSDYEIKMSFTPLGEMMEMQPISRVEEDTRDCVSPAERDWNRSRRMVIVSKIRKSDEKSFITE